MTTNDRRDTHTYCKEVDARPNVNVNHLDASIPSYTSSSAFIYSGLEKEASLSGISCAISVRVCNTDFREETGAK